MLRIEGAMENKNSMAKRGGIKANVRSQQIENYKQSWRTGEGIMEKSEGISAKDEGIKTNLEGRM